jgi:hypothetical protein
MLSNQLSTPAKKLNLAALGDEIAPIDAHALVFGFLVHEMHVSDQRIGVRLDSERIALGPERGGSAPIFGRKAYSCIGRGDSVPSKS